MFEETQPADLDGIDGNDPWAEFRVSHPGEILGLLKQLRDSATPVNLSSPDGSAVTTAIWAVDTSQPRVSFSADKDSPQLQRLLETDEAVAVSYLESVKLQFDLNGLMLVHGARASALQADLPSVIYRFQRRSSYRVRTPERHGPNAEMRHPALPDMRLRLRVMDVSIGGCALFLPDDVPPMQPGVLIKGVNIELDPDTHFTTHIQLRHVASLQAGAKGVRLGCEMVNLGPQAQRALQLYIDQTQKRRRLLTLD